MSNTLEIAEYVLLSMLKRTFSAISTELLVFLYKTYVRPHLVYVTGFWKTDRNVTLGLFHFIGPANAYTHTTHSHCHYQAWLTGLLSRVTFADPVNSWLGQWDPWRALHGRHGCEIHLRDGETSIMPFKHAWAYDWLFWDSWLVQTVLTNGLARLRLPTHPLHPPLPLPPPITCHQWY